jgi:low affinity Fe/Cu permease
MTAGRERMPSSVDAHRSWFDRFAESVSGVVSRAPFFAFAVLLVVVWAPTYWLFRNVDTWQLIVNTATTIGTWLLVALLQNSQRRSDQATQHKLNALAQGLAEIIAAVRASTGDAGMVEQLDQARRELCAAVGLEERESA